MPIEVTMPKLSPTMETGVIAQWLKKVGDTVKEGDVLADIETDKATMPMKSYDDGTIVRIDHAAGEEVALGQRVLVLAKKGEDPKQVADSLGLRRSKEQVRAPAAKKKAETARGACTIGGEQSCRQRAAIAARPSRFDAGSRPREGQPAGQQVAAAASIEIRQVRGTGPGGRIIRRDVELYLEKKPQATGTPRRRAHPRRSRPAPRSLAARARGPAHSPFTDAQDDRPAHVAGQADRSRNPSERRYPSPTASSPPAPRSTSISPPKESRSRSATSSPRPSRSRCDSTRE